MDSFFIDLGTLTDVAMQMLTKLGDNLGGQAMRLPSNSRLWITGGLNCAGSLILAPVKGEVTSTCITLEPRSQMVPGFVPGGVSGFSLTTMCMNNML